VYDYHYYLMVSESLIIVGYQELIKLSMPLVYFMELCNRSPKRSR